MSLQSSRTRLVLVAVASLCVAVVGCSKSASHDVAYYQAHASERQGKFASCSNNPGDAARDPDCANAIEAERLSELDPNNKRVGSILN